MAGWDNTPAPAEGDGWQADTAAESNDNFEEGFAGDNVSKHANGDAPADGGCRK